ncbi:MAG TPA: helix-turn-helix domain-containing protein [Roseiarcus sp.]|jgi:AcrR family transcriptional regulator
MTPRERILDSAARIFAQYGYRLASMELVAQECGLSRQALYHHFDSKEALFRAVSEAVLEGALEAERNAALREERAGRGLTEIMAAQLGARYRHLFDLLRGSAHAEELMSEHQRQTRDLHQRSAQQKSDLIAGTIARVTAASGLVLQDGMTPAELARCVELAARGVGFQKADEAGLADLERSIRLLIRGAVAEAPQPNKPKARKRRP